MTKQEIREEEKLNNQEMSPEGESKNLQDDLWGEVLESNVDDLKQEVGQNSVEEQESLEEQEFPEEQGFGVSKVKKSSEGKEYSEEETKKSAELEKCYNDSLLKIQKVFKVPELKEGDIVSIKYGKNNKIRLTKDYLEMGMLSDKYKTRYFLGKTESGLWDVFSTRYTSGLLSNGMMPFKAEEFANSVDEFVKNADQCEIEFHTFKDVRELFEKLEEKESTNGKESDKEEKSIEEKESTDGKESDKEEKSIEEKESTDGKESDKEEKSIEEKESTDGKEKSIWEKIREKFFHFPTKLERKEYSIEEMKESAKMQECYSECLLKLQEAFKIPELENYYVTIKCGENDIKLMKNSLSMHTNSGKEVTNYSIGKKLGLWSGGGSSVDAEDYAEHVKKMNGYLNDSNQKIIPILKGKPLDVESFKKSVDEFIKDCKNKSYSIECKKSIVEIGTQKNNDKIDGIEKESPKTEKKSLVEIAKESVKAEKFYHASLSKIQKVFDIPKLQGENTLSISYGRNVLSLAENSLVMSNVTQNGTELYFLGKSKKLGIWGRGTMMKQVEGRTKYFDSTFDDKNFMKNLNEFIKNADQCKVKLQDKVSNSGPVKNPGIINPFVDLLKNSKFGLMDASEEGENTEDTES